MPHAPRFKSTTPFLVGFVCVLAILTIVWRELVRRSAPPPKPTSPGAQQTNQSPSRPEGQLARQVCAACHLFPEPEIADRVTWTNSILPRMSGWLGYPTVDWTSQPGGAEVMASGKVPAAPVVDRATLTAIAKYYLSAAPLRSPPQSQKPKVIQELKGFRVRMGAPVGSPRTSLVKIDPRSKQVYVGQEDRHALIVLQANGKVSASLEMPNPIVDLRERPDGFMATMIGSVVPSDVPQGQVARLLVSSQTNMTSSIVLSGLRRPVECEGVDLNEDGREDLVVATFGNILGHFSWFEQRIDGSYLEHILLDRPGAVGVSIDDFDRDGRPDLLVLMAQAQESILLFLNRGRGQFEQKAIADMHPAWGFSHLEMVDFDSDGRADLLITNGDNGDNGSLPNCLKPYHGVRLYLNQGAGQFAEAWFYPMYGAYRALARDFDLDGDMDIIAIAYFPDYLGEGSESFVYLENLGNFKFAAFTFPQSIAGRWITMDAGDLDGDGDADIVMGASDRSFGDVPQDLEAVWRERGPSVVFLENLIK